MANVQQLQDDFLIADEKWRRALIDGAAREKIMDYKGKRDATLKRLLSIATGDDTQPIEAITGGVRSIAIDEQDTEELSK